MVEIGLSSVELELKKMQAPTGEVFDRADHSLKAISDKIIALPGGSDPLEKTITDAANATLVVLATVAGGKVRINEVSIRSNGATTPNLTSAAVKAGTGQAISIITAAQAAQANLDAIDKQVVSDAPVTLVTGNTIVIDLQGTGATAVDFDVTIDFEPIDAGATIS